MKTAVILSARKDKGTDVPYPLKPYHEDICLIDRTIEALTSSSGVDAEILDLQTQLNTEIAARKAVEGQTGSTYTKNTSATHISGATSMNDADVKLNNAITANKS